MNLGIFGRESVKRTRDKRRDDNGFSACIPIGLFMGGVLWFPSFEAEKVPTYRTSLAIEKERTGTEDATLILQGTGCDTAG